MGQSRLHKVILFVNEDGVKKYSRYDRLDAVEEKLRQIHGRLREGRVSVFHPDSE